MLERLQQFCDVWTELSDRWRSEEMHSDPLKTTSNATRILEGKLLHPAVALLNAPGSEAEELFASAREVRDHRAGAKIDLRAVIDISNKCRVNCGFCPMRRDNSHALPTSRAKARDIFIASQEAHKFGFRQLFLQGGEDVTILRQVIEALDLITKQQNDWHFILNFGSHKAGVYKDLKVAGAHGYLIKHETANPALHLRMRGETLEKRAHHMLLARQSGMYIGSGNILGLPDQTDEDLVHDLIFLGRIDSSKMVSCAPFTTSHDLAAGFHDALPGIYEKTLRFIALLRHAFPHARIPATSNLDSPALIRPGNLPKSGQAMAIDAGANGVTVQFTPREIEDKYGLYARGSEKLEQGYLVKLGKARLISEQTGLPLDLKSSFETAEESDPNLAAQLSHSAENIRSQ